MKWYKKQMDKLKAEKSASVESDKGTALKKGARPALVGLKPKNLRRQSSSPVAASKRSRSKTDALPYN